MKLSFKKFMEEQGVVDQTPTTSYHGSMQQEPQIANFPNLETYKQFKLQEDPSRAAWSDMQWLIQWHFDRSHAVARAKRTAPAANTTPITR